MKTNSFFRKSATLVAMISLGFAFSCQENESPYATEASFVAEESVTDSYYQDADDIGAIAVASEPGTAGGKLSSENGILSVVDDRFCANVVVSITLSV